MEQPIFNNQSAAKSLVDDKPTPTPEEYLDYVKNKQGPKPEASTELEDFCFITADQKMLRIKEIVEQIADANVPVLITGESGTGKEIVARMIHRTSKRQGETFVGVNCAALPVSLLESELFGYEKGAFTGAMGRHIGKFEQASQGTLLLDEVTEIDSGLQAKLLRALQEKEIERIGGNGPVKIDTRIIATTNRDIRAIVNEGQFRQDLYYRLYVIHLEVPPLRERPKDIEVLAKYFLSRYIKQFGRTNVQFTADAIEKMLKYPWGGNVRELQNVVQRAILMLKGDLIKAEDLPLCSASPVSNLEWVQYLPIGRQMQEVERHFIIETLKNHNGNRTHAAKTLGISLRTLRNKINEFKTLGVSIPAPMTGKAL